ncbi:MAG: right-handed parallel beta-helix repeat-containing protein [Verrucomicrobiales bacterium]
MQFDDGFALYLNGQEIARDNLAANAAYNDPATSTVVPSQETVFNQYGASAAFLQAGTNTLAAEVHNLAPDNPDLAFDMELVATVNSESSDPLLARPGINKYTVEYWDTEGNRVGSEEIDVWFDDGSVETISGTIASNRTLNASGGPYLLNGDVTVPAGVTLTIQPGTTVYFQPTNGRLTVRGKLVAEGTEYARIRFALQPGQTANYQGVRFIDTDEENILTNVDMRSGDAQGECILIDNSRVTLDGMTWADVDDTIVEVDSPKAIIKNSTFPSVNSSEVIHGNNLAGDDFFILDGNSFGATGGYNDIIDFTGGRRPGPIIQVYNNVFHGASDDVLDLDGTDGHIEGNLFMNVHQDQPRDSLSSAIATDTNSDLTVVRNVFYDVDHALLLKNGSRATFTNNTVVNATLSGIAFDEPQRSGVTPGSAAAVDGCIFWNCTVAFSDLVSVPPEINPVLTVDRCIVPEEFQALGTGNLWADPHLIAPGGDQRDDYAIQPGSAATGRGPNGLDIGALVPAGASISGLPSSPTHLTGATIVVGGPGITHYKRRFRGAIGALRPLSTLGFSAACRHLSCGGRRQELRRRLAGIRRGHGEPELDRPARRGRRRHQ